MAKRKRALKNPQAYKAKVTTLVKDIFDELEEAEEARAQGIVSAVMLNTSRYVSNEVLQFWSLEQFCYAMATAMGEAIAYVVLEHLESENDEECIDSYPRFEKIAEHCYALFRKEFQKVEP